MRAILIAAGIGVVLLGASFVSRTALKASQPGAIVVERPSITVRCSPEGAVRDASDLNAKFRLLNSGGGPVQVLSVESGCGCARPTIRPDTIAPGEVATVDVRVDEIPIGEKLVPISLTTDSPATPRIDLNLKVIGRRPPPYLLKATGDLIWRDFATAEPRELVVESLERKGDDRAPILKSDLPFLKITPRGGETHSKGSDESDIVARTYRYEITLEGRPPEDHFEGEVSVVDPWGPDRVLSVHAYGQLPPPIRVFPQRLILKRDQPDDAPPLARFSVLTTAASRDLRVEPEERDGPLSVDLIEKDDDCKSFKFSVRWKEAGSFIAGEHNLILTTSAAGPGAEEIVIPVVVREGSGR